MSTTTSTEKTLFRELFLLPILAQRRRLLAIFAALLLLALSQGLFLLMVGRFFKALFQDHPRAAIPLVELLSPSVVAYFPSLEGKLVDAQILAVSVPGVIFLAGIVWAIATYVFQLNQQKIALQVARSYREKLFAALISRPYLEIRRRAVGEWMSIVMNDVMFLQMRLSDLMIGLVKDSVVVVAGFAILIYMHWPTALAMALFAPFGAMAMGRAGKRIARYSEEFQRELAVIAGRVLDLRSRFDLIRAQGAEGLERQRFALVNNRYYRMIRKSILIRSAFAPVLEAAGFLVFAACVYAIGHGAWKDFTPALMMQFLTALGVMLKPLRELGEQLTRLHETKGVLRESLAVFQQLKAERDVEAPKVGHRHSKQPFSGLQLSKVRAGFAGEVKVAVSDVSVLPGRSIAVVGPSGSGKSTFIKCLSGLVAPMTWQSSTSWDDASASTSMVSQEPFLFDDTVRANLVYGFSSDSVPGDAEVWQALTLVNVDEEIRKLAEGLETRMRAIGSNVSGGQLQRLVIARALLRRKPLLLLDEATSAIDVKSERDITERLVEACKRDGLAMIAVTHRLQWLAQYDEVWFIEGGALRLRGTHAELLAQPRYAEYCSAQGESEQHADHLA